MIIFPLIHQRPLAIFIKVYWEDLSAPAMVLRERELLLEKGSFCTLAIIALEDSYVADQAYYHKSIV